MRRAAAFAALAALLLVASPGKAGPGPGYFATDNVEYIGSIPAHVQAVGGVRVDDYFYLTDENGLTVYDISDPELPVPAGYLARPQTPYFPEENVDTNGKILIISSLGSLSVIDITDRTNPTVIGELADYDPHTTSCVLDCTYLYGSDGSIVDLRDPTAPKVAGSWPGEGHDVTEISPGLVLTATNPMMLLDARSSPLRPRALAYGAPPDDRFVHGTDWPRAGRDKFVLTGGETGAPACGAGSGAFATWDASDWKRTHTLRMIDDLVLDNGLPTDGEAPVNSFCAHWFEAHPTWRDGGLVAMAWYEHGTRFIRVSPTGKISEVGYFLPVGGQTSAAYWITKDIVYAVDYQRGLDVIRFTGKP